MQHLWLVTAIYIAHTTVFFTIITTTTQCYDRPVASGSRGVRISGSNVGYTMFRGSVKSTGYPLHSPVSPSLPLPCVTVFHHISIGLYHLNISTFPYTLCSPMSRDPHNKKDFYTTLHFSAIAVVFHACYRETDNFSFRLFTL